MSTTPYAPFTPDGSASYVATEATAEIVNLAIRLGRPLLVEGEAGCGKTRLAFAIAEQLGLAKHFVVVNVKSTTQAKDLLYRFDALRRLQDAQDPANGKAQWVHPYVKLEPLGRAIQQGVPSVVLIDEVDKADIDFPNDLLDVLDSFEFDIDELPQAENEASLKHLGFGRHVAAPKEGSVRPVVVITSNREKQLPEPFLRRCLYVQLDFPEDADMLAEIVRRNLARTPEQIGDTLIEAAVQRFGLVRGRARELNMQKLPATSELVDWVRVLFWQQRRPQDVSPDALTPADQAVLFKIRADLERYRARTEEEAGR